MRQLRTCIPLCLLALISALFFGANLREEPPCFERLSRDDISSGRAGKIFEQEAVRILKADLLLRADSFLLQPPVTITAYPCGRSSGNIHDFFSEGDYWWPDPRNPQGPYIRRDGMSNPDNFNRHREVLIRFSILTGTLTSAWLVTGEKKYARAVLPHLRAWFITDSTRMNPHLRYAQAILGRYTGRSIGIIDGIHLMEVAQSVRVLEEHRLIPESDMKKTKAWFAGFTNWLVTSDFGKAESNHPNNHSTCWNMQTALYALLAGDERTIKICRNNFTQHILPGQMAPDGSFPKELSRTKPYGYSLFNLDAMVMNCLILSDPDHDLWNYSTPDGRNIKKAIAWMAPFVKDKAKWPYPKDVMYWDQWPVAQPAFLFGAIKFSEKEWFDLWARYPHFPENPEVLRNMPVRNPVIWFGYF